MLFGKETLVLKTRRVSAGSWNAWYEYLDGTVYNLNGQEVAVYDKENEQKAKRAAKEYLSKLHLQAPRMNY